MKREDIATKLRITAKELLRNFLPSVAEDF